MKSTVIYPPQKNYSKLIVGFFGLAFSLVALFLFALPILKKEISYRLNKAVGRSTVLAEDSKIDKPAAKKDSLFDQINGDKMILYPANKDFSLVIPKIGVNAPVFANINSNDSEEYEQVLAQGVAHAMGSYLPGQLGSCFIFGHSTDYPWNIGWMNAVFYLLKELEKGDEVNVFYQGKRYTYLVSEKKIVEAEEAALLNSRLSEERLVLQTCWPPGTRLKRLLVICHPKAK